MYEGSSFTHRYKCYCNEQEQRTANAWKVFYIVVIVVGLVSLVVLLSGGVLVERIFAASIDNDIILEFEEDKKLSQDGLPQDGLSEKSVTERQELRGNRISNADSGAAEEFIADNRNFSEEESAENMQNKHLKNLNMLPQEEQTGQIKPLVFVDAGHGGADGGCSAGKVTEKDINLAIAKIVQDKLEALGYMVVMSRDEDTFVTKEERVIAANECEADIYISIHQNFSEDKRVNGMEVWYQGEDTQRDNLRLAQYVQQQAIQYTGALERELRGNAEFHVTGETMMPACLVEVGFLSNAKERGKLVSETYQEQVADGIVQGIENYFQSKIKGLMLETIKYTQRSCECVNHMVSVLSGKW